MGEIDISEIRRCPLCDAEPRLDVAIPGYCGAIVVCPKCGLRPECELETEESAIAVWNSEEVLTDYAMELQFKRDDLKKRITAAEAERDNLQRVAEQYRKNSNEQFQRAQKAEAERDKALAQVASKENGIQLLLGLAEILDRHGLMPSSAELIAAAREYRARVVEQCADIAAAATITDHDNLSWTDGRRVAVEAIRAHAAGVREGRE